MKRILSCILVLSCLVSSMPTLAISAEDTELSTIAANVEKHLTSIYPEKEEYGLGDVDFNNLWLGSPIYTYEAVSNTISPYDFRIFPILEESSIVALALVEDDNMVTLTTAEVNTFNTYLNEFGSIAVIYDNSSAYICSENEIVTTWTIDASYGADRSSLATTPVQVSTDDSIIELSTASPVYELGLTAQARATEYFLAVPRIPQIIGDVYYPICWACAAASIGDYLTWGTRTGLDVADATYGRQAIPATETYKCLEAIRIVYGINYDYYTGITSGIPQMIAVSLSENAPVWSHWSYPPNSAHVMVIRGINTTARTFSVADSEYASAYTSGSYSEQGVFGYRSLYSSKQLSLLSIALKR